MRRYVLALAFIFLIPSGMLHGCRKKCGCEADISRSVSNIEARYYYSIHLHLFENPEMYYVICNDDVIPGEIWSAARSAGTEGIMVIIEGKIHNGCNYQTGSFVPNGITLTGIRRRMD